MATIRSQSAAKPENGNARSVKACSSNKDGSMSRDGGLVHIPGDVTTKTALSRLNSFAKHGAAKAPIFPVTGNTETNTPHRTITK